MAIDQLSLVFGALADPTRRAILARLRGGEATVGELAVPFEISQPAVSRHLKVLEHAGLVSRTRRATAPNSRPTLAEATAGTAPDLGFLRKRATRGLFRIEFTQAPKLPCVSVSIYTARN